MLEFQLASGVNVKKLIALLCALATLASITAAVNMPTCAWVEQLGFCTATIAGAAGKRFVAVNAAAAACLANSDDSSVQGCTYETPVCHAVTFAESGLAVCLPPSAKFGSAPEYYQAFPRFEDCVAGNASHCPQVRRQMYTALGCEPCGAIHELCRDIAPKCYSAANETQCVSAAAAVSGGAAGDIRVAEDYGMLGGFKFEDQTLEDDLFSVSQVPAVLPPEEAAAAAEARNAAPSPHRTAALVATIAAAAVSVVHVL